MKKLTIGYVRQKFEEEGYKLVTTNYIGALKKLEYICPKGHIGTICWGGWQQGHRCEECAILRKTTDIEFMKQKFEKEGYKLLSKEYKYTQKLKYVCPKGHKGDITWNSWRQGSRCAKCSIIKNSGSNHYKWKNYTKDEIKQFQNYRENVTQITNQNFKKYYNYINPKNLPRDHNKYHVDHIFTVIDGFNSKISPEVLASPVNLQMLLWKENISKHGRSDIIKETLYELYNQFEREVKETKIV